MDSENTNGLMGDNTSDFGKTESNMDMQSIF